MRSLVYIVLLLPFSVFAQYPPAAGQVGSTAIYADSLVFVNWAKQCNVQRGYYDILNFRDSLVTNGINEDALGKADAIPVSLGDSGVAVLSFYPPITNEPGPDFAVFENSFDGLFLELAFVEVSSDSIHWYRFDAISLTQQNTQVPGFGNLDPTKINNLAGKYRAFYGTPFDLEELSGKPFLNVDSVSYLKIIDVVGTILSPFVSYDSEGNIVNDPYPTPFFTGGFDLDAVGVIHERPQSVSILPINQISFFPNPCLESFTVKTDELVKIELIDITGKSVLERSVLGKTQLDVSYLQAGLYLLKFTSHDFSSTEKILIK